jgi:hypothetical protein
MKKLLLPIFLTGVLVGLITFLLLPVLVIYLVTIRMLATEPAEETQDDLSPTEFDASDEEWVDAVIAEVIRKADK